MSETASTRRVADTNWYDPWQVAYSASGQAIDRLDTLVGDECVLIDLDAIWCEEFARWDALVDSATAARIATAVEAIVRERAEAGRV